MVHRLVAQLTEGLLGRDDAHSVVLHGVDDIVVGHAALHDVVLLPKVFTGATGHHVVEPFQIVFLETQPAALAGKCFVEVIDTEMRDAGARLALGDQLCPPFGLRAQRGKIEAPSEVEVTTATGCLRLADCSV